MKYMTILIFIFVSVSGLLQAQDITFVTENYPPFQISEPGRPLRGFAIDIVEAVKKNAHMDIKINVYPWARAYRMALGKPGTFIFSLARTRERENLFIWVGEYFTATTAVYCLKSRKDIVINSLEDAKKYITGTPRGDAGALLLENNGFKSPDQLHYLVNQEQAIKMLYQNRVDLNVNNDVGFLEALKKINLSAGLFKKVFIISKMPMCIAANKDTDPAIVDRMRRALEQIKRSGIHKKLLDKWFKDRIDN